MDEKKAAQYLTAWAVSDTMLRFAKALMRRDGSDFDIAYFLEKPWKWAGEYVEWLAAGKPDDESDTGWERFVGA